MNSTFFTSPSFLICLLLSAAFGAQAIAQETLPKMEEQSGENLRAVIHHRSISELSRFTQSQSRLRRLKLVCESQLAHNRIPAACFEDVLSESRSWVATLCRKRAAASQDLTELTSAAKQISLPEDCRKAADERSADLRYAEAAENPAGLLRRENRSDLSRAWPAN